MLAKGKLKTWNENKGFGFIKPNAGGNDIFVHINDFAKKANRPTVGQVITYKVFTDKQGRQCAVDARRASDRLPAKTSKGIAVTLFIYVILSFTMLSAGIASWILVIYLSASIVTYVVYALDKTAAQKDKRRTPENTLHLLSLLCGWPGAFIAQQHLRHKSIKQPFRLKFWLTVIVNCGVLVWLHSSDNIGQLQSWVAGWY